MTCFEEVCVNVERGLSCGWRKAVPEWVPPMTDSMSVGHDGKPDCWKFSMFLRVGGQWTMVGTSVEPVEYDPVESDSKDSPVHVAQRVCDELLGDMVSKLEELNAKGAYDAWE